VVKEAEDALLLLGREIYQRAGLVMRPVLSDLKAADDRDTRAWRLVRVTRPYLVNELTCAARFLKYDKRSKKLVPTDAPDKVADITCHARTLEAAGACGCREHALLAGGWLDLRNGRV
jgi:hypothetical protein